jgi:hypothetical protein
MGLVASQQHLVHHPVLPVAPPLALPHHVGEESLVDGWPEAAPRF